MRCPDFKIWHLGQQESPVYRGVHISGCPDYRGSTVHVHSHTQELGRLIATRLTLKEVPLLLMKVFRPVKFIVEYPALIIPLAPELPLKVLNEGRE